MTITGMPRNAERLRWTFRTVRDFPVSRGRLFTCRLHKQSIDQILSVHKYLVDVFKSVTNDSKRSLVSKYLHFHRPDLFYIYDEYAAEGLKRLKPGQRASLPIPRSADSEYATFVLKLFDLQREIGRFNNRSLTPRQLDRLLLNVAART